MAPPPPSPLLSFLDEPFSLDNRSHMVPVLFLASKVPFSLSTMIFLSTSDLLYQINRLRVVLLLSA